MAKKSASINDFELSSAGSFGKPGAYNADYEDLDEPLQEADDDQDEDNPMLGGQPDEDEDDRQQANDADQLDDDAEADDAEGEDDEQDDEQDQEFSYAPMVSDLLEEGVLELPEGKAITDYDDDAEGFQQVITDTVDARLRTTIAGLPATAQRIVDLALRGGSEEDLQSLLSLEDGPDWEEADLDDEEVQKAVVEEAMRLRDPEKSDEEIADDIADLEDLGKLGKQAAKDQKYLVKVQDAQKADVERAVEARELAQAEAYEQEVSSVRNYINDSQSIAGLELTKKDREGFMAYLTVKDRNGKTQADYQNTPERRIQKEFLNYKNFDLGKLKVQARTEAAKQMQKELGRWKAPRANSNAGQRPRSNADGLEGQIMRPGQFQAAYGE